MTVPASCIRKSFFLLFHCSFLFFFFFFNDTATTEIYTLSLHDALPICPESLRVLQGLLAMAEKHPAPQLDQACRLRSEEHTSELQSQSNLVCRLLLEKKKKCNETDYRTSRIIITDR